MRHSTVADDRGFGGGGKRMGPVQRFLLTVMAAVLCLGTLGASMGAVAFGTAATAGAATSGPATTVTSTVKDFQSCAITAGSLGGKRTSTTTTLYKVTQPTNVAPGATFTVTLASTGYGVIPPTTTGATVKFYGTQINRFGLPTGTTLVSSTIVTPGYKAVTATIAKPTKRTALGATTVTVSTTTYAPSGKMIVVSTPTHIAGGDDFLGPTIKLKLHLSTNPPNPNVQLRYITDQSSGTTPPATAAKHSLIQVNEILTITVKDTCWVNLTKTNVPFATVPVHDTAAPTITILAPAANSQIVQNSVVHAAFSCTQTPTWDGVVSCTATNSGNPLSVGQAITTAVLGTHTVTVSAKNKSTISSQQTVHYKVIVPPYNLVPPTITLTSPVNGAVYVQGSTVTAHFSCHAFAGTHITSCTGTVPNGTAITTSTSGYKAFTVKAKDDRGNPTTETVGYTVRSSGSPSTSSTSSDVPLTATASSTNYSCSLWDDYVNSSTSDTCIIGAHLPEVTWKVTTTAPKGGRLVPGDKLTVAEQIYRPGALATSANGGYDSGPYKETFTVVAPAGTQITGPVSTSKTGLSSSTYGGTASASGASACNYNDTGAAGTGTGKYCTNSATNIATGTATAPGSVKVGAYATTKNGAWGSTKNGTFGSTKNGAFGSTKNGTYSTTTVGAYGSTTVNTLYSNTIKATDNGKTVKTIATTAKKITVTSDTGSPKTGRVEVSVTKTGTKSIAVFAYTGHSTSTLTGVTYVSGTKTAKLLTGAFVRQPITSANFTGTGFVLPVSSVTGFQTTAGGEVKVGTTTGTKSAIFKYTSDSTSATTCGTASCFTTVTRVSGTGTIAKGDTVTQVDQTIATNVTLHAAADTNFGTTGTVRLDVQVTTAGHQGTALVKYTGDSTTAATCGSAACFTTITWLSGSKGIPVVGGPIAQVSRTIATYTGATTVLHATSDTGFNTKGIGRTLDVQVKTGATVGTAVVSYTTDSATATTCGDATDCFTKVKYVSGSHGVPVVTGPVTQISPTITAYTGTSTFLHATADSGFNTKGIGRTLDVKVTTHTIQTVPTHEIKTEPTTVVVTVPTSECSPNPTYPTPTATHSTICSVVTVPTHEIKTEPTTVVVTVPTTVAGTGTAVVSYTSDSTTAATCGSAACFTKAKYVSGAHGVPVVTGPVKQISPTIVTYTGTTTWLHATSDTGFTTKGAGRNLDVQVKTGTTVGTAVVSYTTDATAVATCGSAACFTKAKYVSGSHGVPVVTGPITQISPTIATYSGTTTFLHATSDTGFTTKLTRKLAVRVTKTGVKGTAIVSYTTDSTTAATCGSAACFTKATFVSGAHGIPIVNTQNTIAATLTPAITPGTFKTKAVRQLDPTIGTLSSGVLHATADTGFTASGTATVAVTKTGVKGTAVFSYTGDSTTAATCGSAACFTGVNYKSGAKGVPVVTGSISQTLGTVATFTGSGKIAVATVKTKGFAASGLLKVTTTNGTAWIAYTSHTTTSFTGLTTKSGSGTVTTAATGVVEPGLGGNGYAAWTTVAAGSNNTTVSTFIPGGGHLAVASTTNFAAAGGTLVVVTSNGTVHLTYTGVSGSTLTGVKASTGASGRIYSSAPVALLTATAIKGAAKVAGTSVSGWTWNVTVHSASSFAVQWNGSSCENNTGSPTPTADAACKTNAEEIQGIDGTYIYLHYRLVVTGSGTISIPGIGVIHAHQHDWDGTTAHKTGSTTFVTTAGTAPGLSWLSDATPPTSSIVSPQEGGVYGFGAAKTASYSCSDSSAGVTISSCVGYETTTQVTNGHALTTSALVHNEIHQFKVVATSSDGLTSTSYASFVTLASPPVLTTQPAYAVTSGGSVTVPLPYSGTYPVTLSTEKIVTTPSHGTAAIQPTGKITYTNNDTPFESDSFQVKVSDTAGNPSNVETVHLTVANPHKPTITVNTPPQNGSGSYARGQTVLATYTCGDNVIGGVSTCSAKQTVNGTLTSVPDGSPIDTTSLVLGNTHSLTVSAVGFGGATGTQSSTTTVTYTVNTPHPAAASFSVKVPDTGNDTVKALTHVTSTFPITPGTLAVVTLPSHGTATVDAAHVVKYAPRTIGSELTHDSFTYDVKDTDGQLSNKGTVGVTIYPVPTIASISRTSGPTTGGTQVTITGTGFSTVSSIKFGTTPATGVTVRSETQLVAIAPAHAAGTVGISVTTPGGTSATTPADLYKFIVPPPVVSAISPSSGPAAGSTTVTVSGSGLSGASKVYFGTKTGTTISVNAVGNQLTVKSPPGTSGSAVNVRVVTAGGESNAVTADLFTYGPIISSISPATGSTAGGSQVTVTGAGFSTVTHVKFGTTTAQSYTVRSATQIVATAPAHAAGTVGISVTTAVGTTPTTVHDIYKYVIPVPVVSAVSPASGPSAGGTTVTVSGSGLAGATTVFFGAAKGSTISVNAGGTQLTVKSPPGTSGSAVNVRVVTAGGESNAVPADLFTYGPILTSISPFVGSTLGSTQVTITGAGFSTVTHVKFGTTTAASFSVKSATQLVAVSPAHAAGTVAISVTTAAGTTPATSADTFKFVIPVPVVAGVSPSSGPAAGGTTVTVSGSGLAGATTISFGASKGRTISCNAGGTQCTVKTPSGTAGVSVNVQVTTAGGVSAVVPADVFTYGPIISSVSPPSGTTVGGTQVTITGTGFSTVQHVKFGTTTASAYTVKSSTQITATAPAHAAGTVRITVITAGGTTPSSSGDTYQFVVLNPAVAGVSPASGPAAGGTTVTVSGSNLYGASTVFFGSAKGSTIVVNGAGNQLTVKSPAGTAGTTVDVRVKTPANESPVVTADHFTYGPVITSLSRTTGPVAGGTKVTITGAGFLTVQHVKFGATTAASYTVNSATSITATSPAHAAGTVGISVTTVAGTTPTTSADQYKFH